VARGARLAFLVALGCVVSAGGCASDPEPEVVPVVDAGPACEPGSENCACIGGSGCKDELLCIARRCLLTDQEEQADPTTPSRPRPQLPEPPAGEDAGANEPLDAGSDASGAEPPDASTDTAGPNGTPDAAGASSP
jgi:hypothetical protein